MWGAMKLREHTGLQTVDYTPQYFIFHYCTESHHICTGSEAVMS